MNRLPKLIDPDDARSKHDRTSTLATSELAIGEADEQETDCRGRLSRNCLGRLCGSWANLRGAERDGGVPLCRAKRRTVQRVFNPSQAALRQDRFEVAIL
jgi:hypothetical protein